MILRDVKGIDPKLHAMDGMEIQCNYQQAAIVFMQFLSTSTMLVLNEAVGNCFASAPNFLCWYARCRVTVLRGPAALSTKPKQT